MTLREFIKQSGLKQTWIAEQLGITYVAFQYKLSGKHKFTLQEAFRLQEILKLSDEQWKEFFKS